MKLIIHKSDPPETLIGCLCNQGIGFINLSRIYGFNSCLTVEGATLPGAALIVLPGQPIPPANKAKANLFLANRFAKTIHTGKKTTALPRQLLLTRLNLVFYRL